MAAPRVTVECVSLTSAHPGRPAARVPHRHGLPGALVDADPHGSPTGYEGVSAPAGGHDEPAGLGAGFAEQFVR